MPQEEASSLMFPPISALAFDISIRACHFGASLHIDRGIRHAI